MRKVYILARTTPSSTQSLSSTDVAVAVKTLGAKGPYYSVQEAHGTNTHLVAEEKPSHSSDVAHSKDSVPDDNARDGI